MVCSVLVLVVVSCTIIRPLGQAAACWLTDSLQRSGRRDSRRVRTPANKGNAVNSLHPGALVATKTGGAFHTTVNPVAPQADPGLQASASE
jgi:hypothetical protein